MKESEQKGNLVITGDVHHFDPGIFKEQRYYDGDETKAAIRWAEILKENNLTGTLFYTGRCFKEIPENVRTVASMGHVEIGGHTWNCYRPRILYKCWRRLTGCRNGPIALQNWDISRTLNAASNIGINIHSWRNHSYREDRNTFPLIAEAGLTHVSNQVGPKSKPRYIETEKGHLISVGINVWPDHDHMVHGPVFKKNLASAKTENNSFPKKIWPPEKWLEETITMSMNHVNQGLHAVLLVHPGCMMVSSNMELFRELCLNLAMFQSIKLSDVTSENNK